MGTVKRMLVAAIVAAVFCSVVPSGALATSSPVLPPEAWPFGWSLERMTGALALFTASGNDPAYYPDTPFQILYVKNFELPQQVPPDGWKISGSSTFSVEPGTTFFVPMANADDNPPFLAPYPENREDAVHYFFDQDKYGARGWEISVDGQGAPIGARYLAGPVTIPPLPPPPGYNGTHMITLGAFLRPLAPGTHTVTVTGGLFGAALSPTYGFGFLVSEYTYTVIVR